MNDKNEFNIIDSKISNKLLFEVAKLIGIDPVIEPQFLWIAETAIQTNLPTDWKEFEDESGDKLYIHTKTQKIQKIHPVIEKFTTLYRKHKEFAQSVNKPETISPEQSELDIEKIFDMMRERVHNGLSPCTPEIFERLCVFFNIKSSEEYHIARILKATLESYFLQAKNSRKLAQSIVDALPFLRNVQEHQARVTLRLGKEPLVFCSECEARTATVKCIQCKDHFCSNCFSSLHAVGARKKHETIDVVQSVCSECQRAHAEIFCRECGALFCEICFVNFHDKTNKLLHSKKRVTNMMCTECEDHDVEIICEDCLDFFCAEDYTRLHRKGNRLKHSAVTIDNQTDKSYRNGIEIPPLESSQLIDRILEITRSNSYISFLDDNGVPYWYCMNKKTISRTIDNI